ncbi:MAG: arsenate reductase (glutaredoxin) [Bacteroidetes bacterium]|nr:arsenate reductase (glutaredoxin) [Bacteroidota bacterium]
MEFYHNPRCGKSRTALGILKDNGIDPDIREYLKNPPTKQELEAVIKKLGISPLELIRQGESIFKEKYKGKNLSDTEWIEAMLTHPILIERPIFIKENKAVIGRPPENVLNI